MKTKQVLLDELAEARNEMLEQKMEMEMELADWLRTLRSVSDLLSNSLPTDHQMETVRRAIDGLIAGHVSTYKRVIK